MKTDELLRAGVERGIITGEQQDALRALETTAGPEAARGLNAITIAYGIGALVVLFGFGWFLVDRWKVLGDSGLLAVAIGYGLIFLFAAHLFEREGFPTARGVATLLAIGMAPLAMHAFGRWVGIWPPESFRYCTGGLQPFFPCHAEPLAIELVTLLAAIVAIRKFVFAPLMLPVAIVCVLIPLDLLAALTVTVPGPASEAWSILFAASVTLTVAYVVDRRQGGEDYTAWLHFAAMVVGLLACIQLFQEYRDLRAFASAASLLAFAAALYLRRIVYLVAGMVLALMFLVWLATDVFRVTVAFPLVLGVLGLVIILGVVLLQRRFPALVARVSGSSGERGHIPGGVATLLLPGVLALVMLTRSPDDDAERARDQRSHARAMAVRMRHRNLRIKAAVSEVAPPPPSHRP